MAAMHEEMEKIEHAEKTALDKVLGLEECVVVLYRTHSSPWTFRTHLHAYVVFN